jgi:uncharacterized membrane protein (DUF4010 family)
MTLSVAAMTARGELTTAVATTAILIPAAVNTVVKAVLVGAISGTRMGARVALAMLAALLAGATAIVLSSYV